MSYWDKEMLRLSRRSRVCVFFAFLMKDTREVRSLVLDLLSASFDLASILSCFSLDISLMRLFMSPTAWVRASLYLS